MDEEYSMIEEDKEEERGKSNTNKIGSAANSKSEKSPSAIVSPKNTNNQSSPRKEEVKKIEMKEDEVHDDIEEEDNYEEDFD